MNRTIQSQDVYFQPAKDIPENLCIWQDENSGISSLTQAAADIVNGKKVTFALCDRQGTLQPTITEIVQIAMGTDAPRYCGEDGSPEGVGSYSLIASWYDYCKNQDAIAVALSFAFKSHKHYFRLK